MDIRIIEENDFKKGYIELLYQLSNYSLNINEIEFKNKILNKDKNYQIIVLEIDNKIIGAGSIFILNKIHNNNVGLIEDVIIDKNYRSKGYGKLIIEKLVKIGFGDFNCYKIILNSKDHNIKFYESCNFIKVGNELKYNN